VKVILFTLLVQFSAHAQAAEWLPFHAGPDGQAIQLYDWDSLRQTPDGFETDIKTLPGPNWQAGSVHLKVDCLADTWQLSKDCPDACNTTIRDDPLPIGNTSIVRLRKAFCAQWSVPDGAQWRELGTTPQGVIFYDERLRASPGGFVTHVNIKGEKDSFLFEMRINCAENRFDISNYVVRQAPSGLVMNKDPVGPLSIDPDTMQGQLKAAHCTANTNASINTKMEIAQ
jgi:hypothetical protein